MFLCIHLHDGRYNLIPVSYEQKFFGKEGTRMKSILFSDISFILHVIPIYSSIYIFIPQYS